MTYGRWPGQDGQDEQQRVDGGAVPPQWRPERRDSTGLLAWYGPEPGNRQRAYVPQQAPPLFLPARHPQDRQRGFDPPAPWPPYEGPPQPPGRLEPTRQPRGRSWPARHKALTGLLAFTALVVIIIGAANSGRSPSSPGRGATAGLTATTSATTAPTTPAAVVAPRASPAPVSCHPRTSAGNCYEPGEYCRVSDQGASGVTSDGEPITCRDNYGWRWEPS